MIMVMAKIGWWPWSCAGCGQHKDGGVATVMAVVCHSEDGMETMVMAGISW